MKINKITYKTTTTGKDYKMVDVEDGNNVLIGSWWEKEEIREGDIVDWDIVKKGNFTNFYPKRNSQEVKQTTSKTYDTTHPMTLERIEDLEKAVKKIIQHLNLEVEPQRTELEQMVKDLPPINMEDIPF